MLPGKQQHREMKYSSQKGLTALCFLPGQWLGWGGAMGIPPTMPDQAALPLGCRHNTFLTEGNTRNVEQAPRHTGCAKEGAKGNTRFFFLPEKDREERILQESYYRQKGTKT